jgi:hypothetical protein
VSDAPQFGSFDKRRGTDALFGRIDWQLGKNNLLTVRNNFVYDRNQLGNDDNTAINLYEVYGHTRSLDNSLLATLRTSVNPRVTNELKVQHLHTREQSIPGDQLPSQNIPRAIVERVASTVDERNVLTNIQLGGQRYTPEHFFNNVLQLTNNVYYNTNRVNYTFGVDLMYTHLNSLYGSEVNGRFPLPGPRQLQQPGPLPLLPRNSHRG